LSGSIDLSTLVVSVKNDGVAESTKGLQQLEDQGGKTESAMLSLSKVTSVLEGGMKLLGLSVAGIKLGELIKDSAMLAARYETLGVVMMVVGNNAGYTKSQLDIFQKKLQESGISMKQSRDALIQLSSAHIDLSNAQKLGRVAQDAAVIGQVNSSEAMNRIIYGIKSQQVEVLRAMGINVSFEDSYKRLATTLHTTTDKLTETQKAAARTNAVLDAGKIIAGTYEEAMGTAGKQITSLQRYWEDLKVKLGDNFLPALTDAVFAFADALKQAQDILAEISRSEVAQFLGVVLMGAFKAVEVSVTAVIYVVGQLIRLLGAAIADAAALSKGILTGDFSHISEINKSFVKDYDAASASASNLMSKQLGLTKAQKSGTEQTEAQRIAAGKLQRQQEEAQEAQLKIQADADKAAKKAAQEAAAQAKRDAAKAASRAKDIATMQAESTAAFELANAYLQSGEAAFKAAAAGQALADVTKNGGSITEATSRFLRKEAAAKALDGAKDYDTLNAQAEAQTKYNDMVAAGTLTLAQANEAMAKESQLRTFNMALAGVQGEAYAALKAVIDKLTGAIDAKNEADKEQQLLAQAVDQQNQLDMLAKEAELIGVGNAQREIELAQLQARQELVSKGQNPNSTSGQNAIQGAGKVAAAQSDKTADNDNYNKSLNRTLTILQQIDARTKTTGSNLADSFGKFGTAISGAATSLTGYAAKQEEINRNLEDQKKAAAVTNQASAEQQARSAATIAAAETDAATQSKEAQLDMYGSVLTASKSFFSEKSTAFKVLQTAEQAYRLFEFAMSIRSIAVKATETAAHVALNGTKAASGVAAGAAEIFAALGPFGFPVVAAMIGVMAALGFKGGGGSGGGLGYNVEDVQKKQGTGSVLGDSAAKSDSIAKSLELLTQNTNKDLEYSSGMLKSLRSIDTSISAVAAALSKALGAGGALNTDNLGLGTSGNPATLKNLGFGSTTTKALADQGLNFNQQSIQDILQNGVNGTSYQSVTSQTKKKALGITYSNKTSTNTSNTGLDDELSNQISLLIGSMKDGIVSAAGDLGITGAEQVLDSFQVALGKVSLKDMTGTEIQDTLNAIFSKLGDDMSEAAVAGLGQFQKVGEGLFQTLIRVAKDYKTVDVTLQSIGKTFGAVGISSIAARENLVDLAGGLDEFTSAASAYSDAFLTVDEQTLPIVHNVSQEMSRLGLTSIKTKDQFKALVNSIDVSTAAGADLYTSLMAVAPAFAKAADYIDSVTNAVNDNKSMTDKISDARSALTDAYKNESDALDDTISRFQDFTKSLLAFRDSLSTGPAAQLSPEDQYNAAKALFLDTSAKASEGNEDALGKIQEVSQAYLDASKDYYATSQGYFDDLGQVKVAIDAAAAASTNQVSVTTQQLDVLKQQVSGLITINQSVLTVAQAVAQLGGYITQQTAAIQAAQAIVAATQTPAEAAAPAPTAPPAEQHAPNFSTYVDHYADLASLYASGTGMAKGRTKEEFGAYHWSRYGQYEGRVPYAMGGAFTNGVVTKPTSFHNSQMGESGPEAIMPLTNVNGKLGVAANTNNSNSKEMIDKLEELIELGRQAEVQRAAMAKEAGQKSDGLKSDINKISKTIRATAA